MTAAVHPGDALSRAERLTYIFVLGALTALGPFTIDLYLPALPILERELHAPTALVQLTLTATMVGFALGQLFVGPLSDQVGRRRPLLMATAVHFGAGNIGRGFVAPFLRQSGYEVVFADVSD